LLLLRVLNPIPCIAIVRTHLLVEMARVPYFTRALRALKLRVSLFVNIAGAWYGRKGVGYVLAERMFSPGLNSANVGRFVRLREREVAGIEVLSSLEAMSGSAGFILSGGRV
jgi:hypothetical protein